MNTTYRGLLVLAPVRRNTSSSGDPSLPRPPSPATRHPAIIPPPTANNSSITTRHSGSTVWGPGAVTGKLLKWVGEGVERGAEYMVIRTKLGKFKTTQPVLLSSSKTLTHEESLELQDQCRKLVDLCIIGMHYPSGLMTRAFSLILGGFKHPGRQTWSYHIAEAISEREIVDVFEIFQEGFFGLFIFRIDGVVDLETLRFRCPVVAHEIASIISHLARKDRRVGALSGASSLSLSPSNTTPTEPMSNSRPAFSRAIIEAGFFRLVRQWSERGLPHWDQRGIECLEGALKDIADTQEYHGDMETAGEANELVRRLKGRRLLLDVEEVPEPYGL